MLRVGTIRNQAAGLRAVRSPVRLLARREAHIDMARRAGAKENNARVVHSSGHTGRKTAANAAQYATVDRQR